MRKLYPFVIALFVFTFASLVFGREARLVRYPSYSNGRIAFTYLGDIWTADENGQNIQRLTVNKARDAYPRFSPDGKWIAFSSDRNGNLDVFIIPSSGGTAKQLTFHSADDTVLGWAPDGRGVLFSSQRGEDFMPMLYVVSVDGGMPTKAGTDMGLAASFSPDGKRIAYNPKGQVYWRKYYRGAYQTDVWIEDIAAKKFTQLTDFDGRTIVFEHDFGIWKLDTGSRKVTPIHLNIEADTQENASETRLFNSEADEYELATNSRHIIVSVHGQIFTVPVEEGDIRQITDR